MSNGLYNRQLFERALTPNSLKNLSSFTQPQVIPNLHDFDLWETKEYILKCENQPLNNDILDSQSLYF